MATTAVDLLAPLHRLSLERYMRMAEAGVFDDGVRVELIDGVIVEMSPMSEPHARAVAWINKILVPQLDPALILLPQLHIGMPEQRSAPEPDISIITQEDHPSGEAIPLLVIEVSLTSLRYDRGTKSRLYARRGVPEYWILNVAEAVMETHRAPTGELWASGRCTVPATRCGRC